MVSLRVLSVSLTCASFLLLLLVGVSPQWLQLSSDLGTLHFGIWTACKGTFCKGLPPKTSVLDASRGFAVLAICAAFAATLCCLESFLRQASKFFPETNVSAMTCFTAGALGLFTSATFLVFELRVPLHPHIQRTYNWAFYLSWGVGPAFVMAVSPGLAEKLNFKKLTKVMTCLSLLTQLLALVSPYWVELGSPGFETIVGLWTICLNSLCSNVPVGTVTFEVVKALMTLSTLLGFIAVCSVLTSFHTFRKYRLATITNFLTGLCSLASVLLFRVSFTKIVEFFHPEMSPRRGWAFYMGCLAAFLFLASALVSLITHKRCPEAPAQSRRQVSPQPGRQGPSSTVHLPAPGAQLELPLPQ